MEGRRANVVSFPASPARNGQAARDEIERHLGVHRDGLRRYILRALSNPADVEDVLQETACRALESHWVPAQDNPAAFLYRIARNILIDRFRRQKVHKRYLDESGPEHGERPGADNYSEMALAFQEALADLPERCRQVFLLRRHEGLSNSEIAAELGISQRMVQKHLIRALAHFHSRLR